MNDFTKEELEAIFLACNSDDHIISDDLNDKIQSMIDNYCEHPEHPEDDWDTILSRKCSTCGEWLS